METVVLYTQYGFGDAWTLQPMVRHFLKQHRNVLVITDYPEVFGHLLSRHPQFLRCRKPLPGDKFTVNFGPGIGSGLTQYEDMLQSYGIREVIPFRLEFEPIWKEHGIDLGARKLGVVRYPFRPIGATICTPDFEWHRELLRLLREQYFLVCVGGNFGGPPMDHIDLDATEYLMTRPYRCESSIETLINLVVFADLVITAPGHMMHLAQGFGRNLVILFARTGFDSDDFQQSHLLPHKFLMRRNTITCLDSTSAIETYGRILRQFHREPGVPPYCRPMLG